MYYVYLLQNKSKTKTYLGFSQDLKKRLKEHNSGRSLYTEGDEWNLVYYEAFLSELDARRREAKLKQNRNAKNCLFKRVENSLEM